MDANLKSHNPIIELMRAHRSVRSYSPEPVTDEVVEAIVEAAQWAPSSSFRQVCSVVGVRDIEKKRILRTLCNNQRWVEECPVFLVFCADLNRLDDLCQVEGLHTNIEYLETLVMTVLDVGIFIQNAALAAEALGLGTCMIGGLRDHSREVIQLLNLPQGVFGVSGLCLGYPAEVPGQRPRLPLAEVLYWERYDATGRMERLADYDQTIQEAGIYPRKDGGYTGWTRIMRRRTSQPPLEGDRMKLREVLEEQGFGLK